LGREKVMSALLQIIKYKELNSWSVAHFLESQFNSNKEYELVRIGDFLTRNKTSVSVENNIKYKRVTIKMNNNGIFLRDVKIGKEIGTKKQFSIKESQFLVSKIDARNGAFGVVTEEINNAIITGNFWTFDVNYQRINPHFLSLITTTNQFKKFSQSASSGTTGRHYLNEKSFLDVKIPLPSLEKQKEIVKAYQYRVDLAISQEKESIQKIDEIEKYLYSKLGITIDENKNNQLLKFIDFKSIDRWDTNYLLDNIAIKSKYNLVKINLIINTFLKDLDNNSLRIESKKYPNDDFNYIGMENIEKESGKLLNFQKVKGFKIKSQTIKLPKNFFLYGKLRPYLNKYYLNQHDHDNIIVSSEFFVFSVKNIDELYFKFIISSSFIQKQIENHMKGARMPRISEGTFRNLKIPLPPLDIQIKIATYIQTLKDKIEELKEKAEQNRVLALKKFEEGIFSELKGSDS
jgi:restriction endonuclease S subunit